MKIYIYTLEDSNGNVRYVGKTSNIKKRLYFHVKNYNKSNTHKNNWIKSLINKGDYPVISILDEVEYGDSAFFEIYWISQFRSWGFNLTNLTDGGDGINGYKLTKEHKDKIREYQKGRKKSEEHKNNLRKTLLGRKLSDSLKNSIRDGCKNSKKVLETNRRIGLEKEVDVYQYDKFNLLVNKFRSFKEASKLTGIKHISECVNGKRKESGGYYWSSSLLSEKDFILKDIKKKISKGELSINCDKIENILCNYFNITTQEIRKTSTAKNIPKIYLTWMLYNLVDGMSLSMIDDYLGSTGSKFRIKYEYDNQTLIDIGNKILYECKR